jgi:hypothetical protein
MYQQLFSKSTVGAPFRQKSRGIDQKRFLARASHIEQQKQNRSASG